MTISLPLPLRRISVQLDKRFSKVSMEDCVVNDDDARDRARRSRQLAALGVLMSNEGISDESAVLAVVDGVGDCGLDAVYFDQDAEKLTLVQSKWHSDGKGGVSEAEMLKYADTIKKVFNCQLDNCNKRLSSKIEDIDSALNSINCSVDCVFISTVKNKINNTVRKCIDGVISDINMGEDDPVRFIEYNIEDIERFFKSGLSSKKIDFDVYLQNWGLLSDPYKAYYGTVRADAVAEWYRQNGSALFAQNIRFFKNDSEVNRGIVDTLSEKPDCFFYYNNGIKLLCEGVSKKMHASTNREIGCFALKGVSVVNGAQTTGAIARCFEMYPEKVGDASVFVEIIDLSQMPENAAETITRLSNTQNKIEGKDFASLDPVQARIQSELRLEENPIEYVFKTGVSDDSSSSCQTISLDDAVLALACLAQDAELMVLAKSKVGALTADTSRAPYKALFNAGTSSVLLANSVFVMQYVDKGLEDLRCTGGLNGKEMLISRHGNRFILHIILQLIKNNSKFNSVILSSGDISSLVDSRFSPVFHELVTAVSNKYPDAYPANIFKNKSKCGVLKNMILSSEAITDLLCR